MKARPPAIAAPRAARRAVFALALGAALAVAAPPAPVLAQNNVQNGAPGFGELAEAKLPAVVNISTTQSVDDEPLLPGLPEIPGFPEMPEGTPFDEFFREYFGDPEGVPPRSMTALGSGFIIDPEGYVVTNNHVIAGADEITVILQDDTRLPAELIGHDERTDLALLKVEPADPLPALEWGDSAAARVGEWVVAIGNPFGLGGSVTAGIISAKTRNINAGPYDDFIQTDAAINRGNSGGPLFNTDGEVIGVNTAIFSPSGGSVGIGFAVPSSLAREVIADLRDDGEVERGWLGVTVQPVTDEIAEALGLESGGGALVASVTEDSPAAEAGVLAGDVILRLDDRPIEDGRALARAVADAPVDSEATLTLWREGEEMEVDVVIALLGEEEAEAVAEAAPAPPLPDTTSTLGMALAELTPELRARFSLAEEAEGVVVTDVTPGSPAMEGDIRPGDLVTRVDQETVETPETVTDAVEAARDAGRGTILLLRERAGAAAFVALPLGGG